MIVQRDSYQSIFDDRGSSYHKAMSLCPDARSDEFILPIKKLNLKPHHTLADFPSGGGYIKPYIYPQNRYICVESSEVFAGFCSSRGFEVSVVKDNRTSLKNGSVDRVLSIAGVHHERNKVSTFQEMHRILRSNGIACIADVKDGSSVAMFLDTVVDKYTEMGHKGMYLSEQTEIELRNAGFQSIDSETLNYHWYFENEKQMIDYCRLVFALNADDESIFNGIKQYLGLKIEDNQVKMPWQLMCWLARA